MNIKLGPRKHIMQIVNRIRCPSVQAVASIPSDEKCTEKVCEDASAVSTQNIQRKEESLDISKIHNQCISNKDSFDIRKWVSSHPQGKQLCDNLDRGSYKTEDRQLLVRIVCSKLVNLCGTVYPSSEWKERTAEALVDAFPLLKSKRFPHGHESFYDKTTGIGFIEFRLKTLRKTLSPSKKKRLAKTSKICRIEPSLETERLTKEDLEEKIMWMKFKNPIEPNRQAISDILSETMADRQTEIRDSGMTITDVLERYPRLQDYKGDMIDAEFLRMHPNSDTFLGKFSSFYVPRILRYVETKRPDLLVPSIADFNDDLKALVLLPELLPSPNYGKGRGKKGIEDMESLEPGQNKQPILVCISNSFYIKADNKLIACPNHAMKAFDILFKSHFIFSVQYAHVLTNFYNFMGSFLYNISTPRACVDSLNTCFSNIAIE